MKRGLRGGAKFLYQTLFSIKVGRTIAIYRTGQLGDTVVALPVISAIREAYRDATLLLITDRHSNPTLVSSWDVIEPMEIFSQVLFYKPPQLQVGDLWEALHLLFQIRKHRPEVLFYLHTARSHRQVRRDDFFFRILCGIKTIHGLQDAASQYIVRDKDYQLIRVTPETDRLLSIVQRANTAFVEPGTTRFALVISEKARTTVQELWEQEKLQSSVETIIAVGPGSKMPAKRWPIDRYVELTCLLAKNLPRVRIIILGGIEDRELGERICLALKWVATNWAGQLTVIEAAEVLRRCAFYIGNDTGLMHVAAAVGTPCVAMFSARDNPGRWDPYGKGHIVLRKRVPCEGCMLVECHEHDTLCLKQITVEEAFNSCRLLIDR